MRAARDAAEQRVLLQAGKRVRAARDASGKKSDAHRAGCRRAQSTGGGRGPQGRESAGAEGHCPQAVLNSVQIFTWASSAAAEMLWIISVLPEKSPGSVRKDW